MDSRTTISSIDLDQSAYYALHGAEFVSARQIPMRKNKVKELGYLYLLKIELKNVRPRDISVWRAGNAQVPVVEFMKARRRLKKAAKLYLGIR